MDKKLSRAISEYKKNTDFTNKLEKQWFDKFNLLLEFREKHGHVNVPARYEADKSLGYWVRRQRLVHHYGEIEPIREKLLKTVGFQFRLMAIHDWNEMYQKLVAYKNKFGNTKISDFIYSFIKTSYFNSPK